MHESSERAHVIVEELLERSGRAFADGDFPSFQSCISLPYDIETFHGKRRIDTSGELHRLFDALRADHQKNNVTGFDRNVVEAVFKDKATVVATFETRLLNGNLLAQIPYPVFAVIIRTDEGWKANSMTFAIEDRPDHNALLMGWDPTDPDATDTP